MPRNRPHYNAYKAAWIQRKLLIDPGYVARQRVRAAERRRQRRQEDEQHRTYINARQRRLRLRLRDQCFAAYGGAVCRCCGETEISFLVLDHIKDDGAAQRRLLGYGNVYSWLRKRGFPPGYQVLCHNCNFGKSHGGCVHGLKLEQELEEYWVNLAIA